MGHVLAELNKKDLAVLGDLMRAGNGDTGDRPALHAA